MDRIPFENNSLWGFVDKFGEIVIAAQFLKVKNFKDGFALVCRHRPPIREYFFNEGPDTYSGSSVDLWGLIDPSGKILIEPIYENLKLVSNNFASGIKYAGIGFRWNDWCNNGIFALYFDLDGSKELGRFREVFSLGEGNCLVEKGRDRPGKDPCHLTYKIFDPSGTEILTFGGGNALSLFENGFIKIGNECITSIFDQGGKKIFEIECPIDQISQNLGGFYLFRKSGRIYSLVLGDDPAIHDLVDHSSVEFGEISSKLIQTFSRD